VRQVETLRSMIAAQRQAEAAQAAAAEQIARLEAALEQVRNEGGGVVKRDGPCSAPLLLLAPSHSTGSPRMGMERRARQDRFPWPAICICGVSAYVRTCTQESERCALLTGRQAELRAREAEALRRGELAVQAAAQAATDLVRKHSARRATPPQRVDWGRAPQATRTPPELRRRGGGGGGGGGGGDVCTPSKSVVGVAEDALAQSPLTQWGGLPLDVDAESIASAIERASG
jgi:hypothetical protein